jgi:hypothetical protein
MWTVESVKAALPAVEVRLGRQVVRGRIRVGVGRGATVSITNAGRLHAGTPLVLDIKVSWESIVESLNSNRALIA